MSYLLKVVFMNSLPCSSICQRLFVLLSCCFLSIACSTYNTNSDISFESVEIDQKPEIFIGDNEFESYRLDYLGWVDAKVTPPSLFHAKPTQAQVDVVIARIAKDKGAQGVFFVTYNWDVFGTLRARGQAVKIHGIDQLATYKVALQKQKDKETSEKIAVFNDENSDNFTVFTDVEDDPLVEAYMQANSIEKQIAEAGPVMIEIAKADFLVTLEQLKSIQIMAQNNKDIVVYEAVSELLRNLKIYE
jgi:hypothetical protein